ncbi:MAG: hypothetical protein JRE23_08825 [Deltaproteobacteria bacterium]|nr:hypothetical protein [Deltaproteobacteria bacterium]
MGSEAARLLYESEEECKKPDSYFCELVEKHFGESHVGNKVDEYLKDHDDIVSDSSIIYHVFNAMRSTKFAGSFRQTWGSAMSLASRFFPKSEDVEKFVVASLLKFAIAVRKDVLEGRGKNYWKKEMEAARETMECADDEATRKADILNIFSLILSGQTCC